MEDFSIRALGLLALLTGLLSTRVRSITAFKYALLAPTMLWALQSALLDQIAGALVIAVGGLRIWVSAHTQHLSMQRKRALTGVFIVLGLTGFFWVYNGGLYPFAVLAANTMATYGYFCLSNQPLRLLMTLTSSLYVVYGFGVGAYELALMNSLGALGHCHTWWRLRQSTGAT